MLRFDLWTMLRGIDLEWVLNALNPVPAAMLWVMVLCHPAVRGRRTVVEVEEAARG